MLQVGAVTPQETAYLVLRYLQDNHFGASARQFAAEADGLLRLITPPPAHQQVKGLHALLCEYVALHARARQREAFERGFGDDANVRGCLSKLSAVMDDYMALRGRTRASAPLPAGGRSPAVAPAAGLVPFVPDALGARLDPRRFKFAPRNAMAAVQPAGRRNVRCDNLGK